MNKLYEFVEKRCLEIIYPKKSVKKMLDDNWAIVIGHSCRETKLEFKMRHPLSFSRIAYCIEKHTKSDQFGVAWETIGWELIGKNGQDLFFESQKKSVQLTIAKILGYNASKNK